MKQKKVYLTFDIETVTTRFSKNLDFNSTVLLGALTIAQELKIRGLNGIFFISMSPKSAEANVKTYHAQLQGLIHLLKSFDNIELAPHIHACGLPMEFSTSSDQFGSYSYDQRVELLSYAKEFFSQCGVKVKTFRAGGFINGENYYHALHASGYKASSTLEKLAPPVIDMLQSVLSPNHPRLENPGIMEYPVTSVWLRSIKRKYELINLSPDFLTLESVKHSIQELDYINVNFHSFSMYSNRLIRENHHNLYSKNLQYLLAEKIIQFFGSFVGIKIIKEQTVFRRELSVWLDFFSHDKFTTLFMNEKPSVSL